MVDLDENDIGDIEDLISADDIKPHDRYENKKHITIRAKKRQNSKENATNVPVEKPIYESVIPGTQKVNIFKKHYLVMHNIFV